MKAEELKQAQKTLGLNNRELAEVLHCSTRSVERFRSGNKGIPGPVGVLVDLLVKLSREDRDGQEVY